MNNWFTASEKIKILREVYKLSVRDLAELLTLKSSGQVTQWERDSIRPSIDVMMDIAEIFGISLDWMVGFAAYPYNNDIVIKMGEMYVEAALQKRDTGSKWCYLRNLAPIINKYYATDGKRNKYSIVTKANLNYYFYIYMMYANEREMTFRMEALGTDEKIKNLRLRKKIETDLEETEIYIEKLLTGAEPFFDLTK